MSEKTANNDDVALASSSSSTRIRGDGIITLLVLGDGDFSFSFDWARHLAQNVSSIFLTTRSTELVQLLATGLDSKESLLAKYKDSNFLLKGLQGLDKTEKRCGKRGEHDSEKMSLHVSVHHGVNAICRAVPELPPFPFDNLLGSNSNNNSRAHHVVFHHPHLGTEDAVLHAQFLCHLFHSVANVWLMESNNKGEDGENNHTATATTLLHSGCFHLTLVIGQFVRWKCAVAAQRHGMVLIHQRPFRPPQVENPYYQHRRHQTGKSFAARAPAGSETYTFARCNTGDNTQPKVSLPDKGDDSSTKKKQIEDFISALLESTDAGRESKDANSKSSNNNNHSNSNNVVMFACPHCNKAFREERSRKCHVKSVHGSQGDNKRKREDAMTYSCSLCQSKDGEGPRLFQTAKALAAHQKAKHLQDEEHNEIKPNWLRPSVTTIVNKDGGDSIDVATKITNSSERHGCCDICGLIFESVNSRDTHRFAFVPSDVNAAATSGAGKPDFLSFVCNYCKKGFRENRAQRQHENFCKSKP